MAIKEFDDELSKGDFVKVNDRIEYGKLQERLPPLTCAEPVLDITVDEGVAVKSTIFCIVDLEKDESFAEVKRRQPIKLFDDEDFTREFAEKHNFGYDALERQVDELRGGRRED